MKLERPQVSLASIAPLLPVLAVACALLAAWFGWSGWQQYQDATRRDGVQQSRDAVVQAIGTTLAAERTRLEQQLENPVLRAAIGSGDFARAGALLADGWPGASDGVVLAPALDSAYAALPEGGFGRLSVLEDALASDAPVAHVVDTAAGPKLALAAPVRLQEGGEVAAVALVNLALERITGAVTNATLPGGTYLAVRQGGYNVVERGDAGLSGGAEVLAKPVTGAGLRVAAAVPDVAGGPFGLAATGCLVAAAVLALLAALALVAWRAPHLLTRRAGAQAEAEDGVPFPTLAEATDESPAKTEQVPMSDAVAAPATNATATGPVSIDRGIFRAYDIRGVVGRDLSPQVAELIGQAIGSLMQDKGLEDIVVGRDGRLSGPDMAGGLVTGLRKAGRNVIDIGLAPTPLVYFGAYQLQAGSCVSVTGSHNPPDYNGFKIVVGGETLSGDAITDLYARIADDRLHTAPSPGRLEQRTIDDDYIQRVASDIQIDRPLKVVVDAGNGVAGELGPKVLAAIGAEVVPLYCDIDGTFPNHHPDPSEPHNLADLIQMVQHLDADLGVAFDGDGDRLGVVTRDGHNIFPDRLLMLFAADVLERNPGAQIIFDVKCTGRLPGHVLRHGGSPLMWKTGHSLIKAKMRETGAELAGEMSGHFFFGERWYGFDDGIYSAARLLEILAAQPGRPSDVLDALPDGVATPEIKVDAPDGNPHAFVERFVANAAFADARLSTIDGLRVDWADGWGLVRASNTTPVLVMRFDADNNEAMARIKAAFREQLLALRPDLDLPF
ncbi:phosphomannomutase [Lysobacter arseniciresistens ZS79]|uniref:phosphomannomutase n=1 Tax=Lysobacter arseniciresistens ZS79 TaxID=913325 RepID=A0A0A0F0P8_9GAMM|nr:phosphomannomutase [Lysobacter arseniciresistens ZS79]